MKRTVIATWLLVAAIALVGCGDDPDDDGSNNAGSGSAGSNSSTNEEATDHEQRLEWADCLREQGLEVEDPGAGNTPPRISGDNMDPAEMQAAMSACSRYAPGSDQTTGNDPEMLAVMKDYAKCLRDHGVEVEDPGPDGRLNIDMDTMNDPRNSEAIETCSKEMSEARQKLEGQ